MELTGGTRRPVRRRVSSSGIAHDNVIVCRNAILPSAPMVIGGRQKVAENMRKERKDAPEI